jgi:hypothetical protein
VTRKISISLPDDIAEHLDHIENASAYIAEAIRRQRKSERTRAFFAEQGIHITDEGVAAAGEKLKAAEEKRRRRRAA